MGRPHGGRPVLFMPLFREGPLPWEVVAAWDHSLRRLGVDSGLTVLPIADAHASDGFRRRNSAAVGHLLTLADAGRGAASDCKESFATAAGVRNPDRLLPFDRDVSVRVFTGSHSPAARSAARRPRHSRRGGRAGCIPSLPPLGGSLKTKTPAPRSPLGKARSIRHSRRWPFRLSAGGRSRSAKSAPTPTLPGPARATRSRA